MHQNVSHNAPSCNRNVHTCSYFCYKMVHCGMWDWCILLFVQQGLLIIISATFSFLWKFSKRHFNAFVKFNLDIYLHNLTSWSNKTYMSLFKYLFIVLAIWKFYLVYLSWLFKQENSHIFPLGWSPDLSHGRNQSMRRVVTSISMSNHW